MLEKSDNGTGEIEVVNRRHVLQMGVGLGAAGSASLSVDASSARPLTTPFSRSLAIAHPFVCAGMAFVCEKPALAIAVAKAGGVGCLAGSLLSPSTLSSRVQVVKEATDGPFHINLLTPFLHVDQVSVCIEHKAPAVSFHWGLPAASIISRLIDADIEVWAQVGNVVDAMTAKALGVSCIVAQGSEAGGHNYGSLPLTTLLPLVRDAIGEDTLLLGAGGIVDGRTAAAAFVAGADGIWVGTRLIATHEANAHEDYKHRLVAASSEQTVLTSVYGPEAPTFNPMRVLRNATVDEWQHRVQELPHDRSDMATIGTTVFAEQHREVKPFDSFSPVPQTTGDFEQMPMMSGQGVGQINDIVPAGVVVKRMINGAARVLAEQRLSL